MIVRILIALALVAGTLSLAACSAPAPADPAADQPQTEPTAPGAAAAVAVEPPAGAPTAGAGVATTPEEAFVAGGPRFVSAAAVAQAVDSGTQIVFVDARPPTDYEFGHIPDAVNVPYYEPEQHLDSLPKDAWIVAYCECPHAEAEQVAQALETNGFTQVRVIDEGLQGWRDLGREIVGGTPASNG